MKLGFRLVAAFLITLLIVSCGNRKSPTGGKVDTEKPILSAISPDNYSGIDEGIIEITFSKPMDRSSVYDGERGLYFYPLINQKKYRWTDNTLTVEINEELLSGYNYYLSVSENIRDLRNNNLEKDYLFIFHTGKLVDQKIDGYITYEKEEDIERDTSC